MVITKIEAGSFFIPTQIFTCAAYECMNNDNNGQCLFKGVEITKEGHCASYINFLKEQEDRLGDTT